MEAGVSSPSYSRNRVRDATVKSLYARQCAETASRTMISSVRAPSSSAPNWSLTDASGKTVSLTQYKGRPLVLIFYEGSGCLHCAKQLNSFAQKAREFADIGIDSRRDRHRLAGRAQGRAGRLQGRRRLSLPTPVGCEAGCLQGLSLCRFQRPAVARHLSDRRSGPVRWREISDQPFNDPALVLKARQSNCRRGGRRKVSAEPRIRKSSSSDFIRPVTEESTRCI